MALGVNFLRSEFQSDNGTYYRIDIYDSTNALGPGLSTFVVDENGFTLTYKGKGRERYDPIKESNVTIGMFFDLDIVDKPGQFIGALQTSDQGRFKIKISRSDDGTNFGDYWLGIVLADIFTINDESGPRKANIKATCGLALMKDIPFNRDVYNGDFGDVNILYTFSNIVTNFLRLYTGGHADFFESNDPYWYELIHWYEDTMPTPAPSESPWLRSAIYPNAFNDIQYNGGEPEKVTPISAYDALKSILDCWGCRIFQNNGLWWVVHHDMYRNSSSLHYYRLMSKVSATPIISGTLTQFNTVYNLDNVSQINNNDRHAILLSGSTETYFPALRKTRATYSNWTDAGMLGDFQQPIDFVNIATLESNLIEIGFVENVANAFISINHNTRVKRVSGQGANFQELWFDYVHIVYMLKIGQYYYDNDAGEWTTTPTLIEIPIISSIYQYSWVDGNDMTTWSNVNINISTDNLPISGQLEYQAEIIQGNPYTDDGGTSGTSVYDVEILPNTQDNPSRVQFTTDGETSFERSFITEDLDSTANEVIDLGDMRIGDGPGTSAPYWGRIRVSDGSSFANLVEDDWQGWETGTQDRITQILTEQHFTGQRDFTPKKNYRFKIKPDKTFDMLKAIVDYTEISNPTFVCNGFKLIANKDEVEGEYWLTRYNPTDLSLQFVDLEEYESNPAPGDWFW
ncbi:hypothetical protein CMK13_05600 [Candidatus Poribacteria bacterium]|nr:hypothetical protein [Candidatus Poribacteria bacterium]|tara:strand:- start:2449 stop:4503 length:2055 start_codon:yes stop_codon:yes gene_type:complete